MARRRSKGKLEYLVRWHGLSCEHDTWNSFSNIPLAKRLVDRFHAEFRRNSPHIKHQGSAGMANSNSKNVKGKLLGKLNSLPQTAETVLLNDVNTKGQEKRRRPQVIATKVMQSKQMAKKVVQRSAKTLQKVSNMNNLNLGRVSQETRTASQVTRARSRLQTKGKMPQRSKEPANIRSPSKRLLAKKSTQITGTKRRTSHQGQRKNKVSAKSQKLESSPPQGGNSNPKSNVSPKIKSENVSRKRKREQSSSDDDTLYTLSKPQQPSKRVKTNSTIKGGSELKKLLVGPNPKTVISNKKVKQDTVITGKNRSAFSGRVTPDSTCSADPEISFRLTPSKKSLLHSPSKKLLLKDSIRAKPKATKPEPRSQSPLPTVASAAAAHTPSTAATASHPATYRSEPSTAKTVDSMDDLPNIPVMPRLPSSPSACAYKTLVRSLSSNMQGNRGFKKKNSNNHSDEGDSELVERRISVRQSESAFKYKDIVVKKYPGYTQIWLFSQTKMKNAFNPKVFQELMQALHNAKFDDSRLVMLSGSGTIFSSGIDLHYLVSAGDRRLAARHMAEAVREFTTVLMSFPKPIIAAVNGPAIGLGAAILPLCDIVYASDKASFYCPYARLCQTPESCSSYTFPQVMGMAMANELLLGGRKLTAMEAYEIGLVSQVFWPTSMMQEVVPRVQNMAAFSAKGMESSKILIRSHQRAKLQFTIETECQMLAERWSTSECLRAMQAYIEDEQDLLA